MTSEALLSRLERQCSRCEYCSSDIRKKALSLLAGDARKNGLAVQYEQLIAIVDPIVESLKSNGYVDDLRYASAFAREKSGITGWGPVKIRYALKSKEIDTDTIEMAMTEIDSFRAESKLEKLMVTKWKSLEGDPQAKLKLIKFALGRGYDYDSVSELLPRVVTLLK